MRAPNGARMSTHSRRHGNSPHISGASGKPLASRWTTPGTDFQRHVWAALRDIPFGTTTHYQALAARINKPAAVRAVAAANGANRVSILIPCHRVIGSDGKLTGYAGGLNRKQSLLALERGEVQTTLF